MRSAEKNQRFAGKIGMDNLNTLNSTPKTLIKRP